MITANPTINTYKLHESPESVTAIQSVLSHLRSPKYLKTALPLYRRLQFGRFLEGSHLITNRPLNDDGVDESTPWFYAFADRSCRPETEVWLFGNWEISSSQPHGANGSGSPQGAVQHEDKAIASLLQGLVLAIKALGVPASIHQDAIEATGQEFEENDTVDSVGLSRADYASHNLNPNVTLWGAIHARSFPHLQALGVLAEGSSTTAVPNHMFIIDVDHMAASKPLPSSVRWGKLEKQHLALVRSRTQIPRQDRTLIALPNLGLFPTQGTAEQQASPIAWAFVGLDASLTTLHVETEYRRMGLAQSLTTKLFKEMMGRFWVDGQPKIAQGYVIVGNGASAGMCKALGGVADWEVYWIRVDLDKVT